MQINEVCNKEEFSALVINELKNIGVLQKEKCRKDKKAKLTQEKACRKRIFRTHLHALELTDVILASGTVVQIPKFVADACNRILEHVETEGVFRKAGSSLRQKEIRISLEAGLPLGKSHHVIDVANVVKYFFRELPEPLIPIPIQETLLRSFVIGGNYLQAVLLTLLLLPPLTINTLSFFMQFLYTVSLNADSNKMSVQNLAIIFTPSVMPFPNINNHHRFNNHVKMVQLLIEHANAIGTIPDCIADKVRINNVNTTTPAKAKPAVKCLEGSQKKKKKRRSEMFSGLKKIVGSAIGSVEHLEATPECKAAATATANANALAVDQKQTQPSHATPCIKSNKKRKFADPVCAFSAKKKRDLLALLPSNSGGFLPNTPLTKESKKSRLSLGGNRHLKNLPSNLLTASMERRWSVGGGGWSKQKAKRAVQQTAEENLPEEEFSAENNTSDTAKVASPVPETIPESMETRTEPDCSKQESVEDKNTTGFGIAQNEYEAIKERVAVIETCISQEFNTLYKSLHQRPSEILHLNDASTLLSGPERVQNEFEQVVEKTETFFSPTREQLAQRLNRDLRIRRSMDPVIRSPSARRIGTIRRRSQEKVKVRLSRNPTWHVASTAEKRHVLNLEVPAPTQPSTFYTRGNIKRGRPNTVHTGLVHQPVPCTPVVEKPISEDISFDNATADEQWTAAEVFFGDTTPVVSKVKFRSDHENKPKVEWQTPHTPIATPVKQMQAPKPNNNNMLTPMLPPKSLPRKTLATRTPHSALKSSAVKNFTTAISTPTDDTVNGRASIARLRTQNAGMVLAKAKLFDGLGGNDCERHPPAATSNTNQSQNPKRRSSQFTTTDATILTPPLLTPLLNRAAICESYATRDGMKSPSINRQKLTIQSPGSVKKRHRLPISRTCPYKEALGTIMIDDKLIQYRNAHDKTRIQSLKQVNKENSKATPSPRRLHMRNNLHYSRNSPRRKQHMSFLSEEVNRETTHSIRRSSQKFPKQHVKM